jgi:orotate phosphoribosyltransferase
MHSESKTLATELLTNGIIQINPDRPITFKSGVESPVYGDVRKVASMLDLRKLVLGLLVNSVSSEYRSAESICGVASGALLLTGALADRTGLPAIYYRQPKDYGNKKSIEGILLPGQKVVVIEDVISTGGSALKAVESLRSNGANVLGVLAIYDHLFEESKQEFEAANCSLRSLTNFHDVISAARKIGFTSEENLREVEKWHNDPFAWRK